MMNKLYALFLLGCTLAIINGCASHIAEERDDDIQILVEIRPEVNYVTHIYTLAELGFSDSAYAEKYGGTLPEAGLDAHDSSRRPPRTGTGPDRRRAGTGTGQYDPTWIENTL